MCIIHRWYVVHPTGVREFRETYTACPRQSPYAPCPWTEIRNLNDKYLPHPLMPTQNTPVVVPIQPARKKEKRNDIKLEFEWRLPSFWRKKDRKYVTVRRPLTPIRQPTPMFVQPQRPPPPPPPQHLPHVQPVSPGPPPIAEPQVIHISPGIPERAQHPVPNETPPPREAVREHERRRRHRPRSESPVRRNRPDRRIQEINTRLERLDSDLRNARRLARQQHIHDALQAEIQELRAQRAREVEDDQLWRAQRAEEERHDRETRARHERDRIRIVDVHHGGPARPAGRNSLEERGERVLVDAVRDARDGENRAVPNPGRMHRGDGYRRRRRRTLGAGERIVYDDERRDGLGRWR